MKPALPFLAALFLLPAAVFAAEDASSPPEAYYRAFYQEKGLRDFAAAEQSYRAAIAAAKAADRPDLVVSGLTGRARCLVALGREEEAKKLYESVLALDPDNAEAGRALAKKGAGGGDDVDSLVASLVRKLGGPERAQAKKDLLLVGDRAVPALAEGLRSDEVGIAEGSAQTLAGMRTAAADATLGAAFADPAVKFPNALFSSLDTADPGVFTAAFRATDAEGRKKVFHVFQVIQRAWYSKSAAQVEAFFRAVIADGDPARIAQVARYLGSDYTFPTKLTDRYRADFWRGLLESKDAGVVDAACDALRSPRYYGIWDEGLVAARLRATLRYLGGALPGSTQIRVLVPLDDPRLKVAVPGELLAEVFAAAGGPASPLDLVAAAQFRTSVEGAILRRSDREGIFSKGWSRISDAPGRSEWLRFCVGRLPAKPEAVAAGAADSDPGVRSTAYSLAERVARDAYSDLGKAFPHLVEDIAAPDPSLAAGALKAVAIFRVATALPAVRRVLAGEPARPVKEAAIRALAALGGDEAIVELRRLMATDDWSAARDPLVALVGVDAAPDLVALAERLKDGWAPVVDRFNRVGIPTAVFRAYVQLLPKPLRSPWFLQMNDCTARLTSDQLHTLAIDALASDTSSWQAAGAGVAGRYHFADAWARLLVLLDSPDPSVQKSAQTALEELRTYLDLKASFARYGEGGPEKALARARELTKSDDARLRRGGALALGALGEPAGVPDLMDLLDDPDPAVRQAALDALTRLGGAPVPGAGGKPKPK